MFLQLIEDLRKQLEHLQLYKLEVEAKSGRSPSAGLQEYQNRTREAELEQEVRRLKQVRSREQAHTARCGRRSDSDLNSHVNRLRWERASISLCF